MLNQNQLTNRYIVNLFQKYFFEFILENNFIDILDYNQFITNIMIFLNLLIVLLADENRINSFKKFDS